MAFRSAIARYATVGDEAFDSRRRGYAPNTNSVGIIPSDPAVLLRALKAI